jgi:glycosyltransferase involved in cell wall biosynthesis
MNFEASAVLLNYRKKNSLIKTIKSIRSQSIPVEIILIDNSGKDECKDLDIDFLISSSKNLHCKSRFLFSQYATADFIFTLDDDVILQDSTGIEHYLNFFKDLNNKEDFILVDKNNHYKSFSKKNLGSFNDEWEYTNYGKGRFLFFHRSYLNKISIGFHDFIDPYSYKTCSGLFDEKIPQDFIVIDDISFQKKAKNVLYSKLRTLILDQETAGIGCHQKPHHYESRERWILDNE